MTEPKSPAAGDRMPDPPDPAPEMADALRCAKTIVLQVRSSPHGVRRDQLTALQEFGPDLVNFCLQDLLDRDVLRSEPGDQSYSLSFSELQSIVDMVRRRELALVAQPELSELRNLCGESAVVAVDDGQAARNLAHVLGPHPIPVIDDFGTRFLYHCSASGKVFLAYATQERQDRLLNQPLTQRTEHTLRDRAALRQDLQETKRRGYSISDEEFTIGQRAVSAPIFGENGEVIGCITVAGPPYRIPHARIPALAEAVKAAARRITDQMIRPDLTPKRPTDISVLSEQASGECSAPKWSEERQAFLWIDRDENQLWQSKLDGSSEQLHQFTTRPQSLVVTTADQVIALCGDRLVNLSSGKESLMESPVQCAVPATANDIWAVTERYGEKQLINLTLDGHSSDHAVLPLGLGSITYCAVSGSIYLAVPDRGEILSYNLITRQLKQICQFSKASGRPAALAIDANWSLWVAFEQGWGLSKLSLNGQLLARYTLPLPHPTGLCFGGPNRDRLMVTSKRDGQPQEVLDHAPLAGHALLLQLD